MFVRNYIANKADNVAILELFDDEIRLVETRFDPRTGDALPDSIRTFRESDLTQDKEQLTKQIARLQAELADIDKAITDIATLKVLQEVRT